MVYPSAPSAHKLSALSSLSLTYWQTQTAMAAMTVCDFLNLSHSYKFLQTVIVLVLRRYLNSTASLIIWRRSIVSVTSFLHGFKFILTLDSKPLSSPVGALAGRMSGEKQNDIRGTALPLW